MVLPRADRPHAPPPPHVWLQGPRGWVQVPCEGARQLRCAVVRLWGCGDDDFWMLCEGRALADDMKVPQSGSHVQVRLRGVGGMEEALREEAGRKGTAREGSPSGAKAAKKDKGKGKKMISFREYTQSGLHAQWSLVAPQKDFMRLRMEIQTDLNKLSDRKEEWVEKAVKAHGLELTTVELVEYIACYCLLEDLRFDVDTGNFAKAVEENNEQSPSGISEVLKKLEMLEQRLEEVQLGKSEPSRKIPKLSHKELSILMEMDHKPQWVCRLLVFFKAVLDGQKVDPKLMECTSAWKSSDLQEELVMSPEKAQNKEVWTSPAWLEAVTAPMDGSDGGGTPRFRPWWPITWRDCGSCWCRRWGRTENHTISTPEVGVGVRPQRKWESRQKILGTLRSLWRKSVAVWLACGAGSRTRTDVGFGSRRTIISRGPT